MTVEAFTKSLMLRRAVALNANQPLKEWLLTPDEKRGLITKWLGGSPTEAELYQPMTFFGLPVYLAEPLD